MEILYEDNHVIVAYKDKGILSQADGSNKPDMLTLLKDYIKEKGFDLNFYFDIYKDAVFQYGITAYPTTFFLDSKGNIVSYSSGSLDYDGLVDCIEMIRMVK